MLDKFMEYLGEPDSLKGYVRSYKLVFLKCFFKYMESDGTAPAFNVSEEFKNYYLSRKKAGKIPDKDTDAVITNIEKSSNKDIYNLIIRNPFSRIKENGFFDNVFTKSGKIFFKINSNLLSQLTAHQKVEIEEIIDHKLNLYFSNIDNEGAHILHDLLCNFSSSYPNAKNEKFAEHPIGHLMRHEIPDAIHESGLVDENRFLITGSVGNGNWATIPWLCIFNREITTSAQKGVYIVYLFSKDCKSLYLTLNQGCTEISKVKSKKDTLQYLESFANDLRSKIDNLGFSINSINLGDNIPNLGQFYERGTIFSKKYKTDSLPSDDELFDDLKNMLKTYDEYYNLINNPKANPKPNLKDDDKEMATKDILAIINDYIKNKGFNYADGLVENFYLSLKSKPFVILAGTSGTGKTRLVRLFAEAVGATSKNGRYKLVSVRPDWSDSTDLFGHTDLNGNFIPGAILDFIKKAESDKRYPYFLCLDEMNLARVEYYLSDVLSIIETRDFKGNEIITDPLIEDTYYGSDEDARKHYGTIGLPENLYIIGTVNMDETTFPFSKKVLDRANTIEFSYVDLMPSFDTLEEVEPLNLPNSFLKTEYLLLNNCTDNMDLVNEFCTELQKINEVLKKANAHIGYRVRDEIVFYMINDAKAELLKKNEAMDNEIMQKILPRIQGSNKSTKDMLCDLFKICAGDFSGYQVDDDNISEKMIAACNKKDCRYPKSAQKIAFMVRRYEEDGFTSYWL